MQHSTTSYNQDDKKFTIALISFVMWVFITGILLVYAIVEFKCIVLGMWIILSLLIFRTMNMIYNTSHSHSKQWLEHYKIKLLIKSPLEAIF